jgi:hypothetical protein
MKKYRVTRNQEVKNENLFSAWKFEYKTEKYGWREVKNLDTKTTLKEFAIKNTI